MDMREILKQLRALSEGAECNMTESGEYCPVHGMEECSAMNEEDERNVNDGAIDEDNPEKTRQLDDEYYQAIKNGGDIPDVVVEPDRFIRYYEEKYGKKGNDTKSINDNDIDTDDEDLKEDVSINVTGDEANEFIQRLSALAGTNNDSIDSMPNEMSLDDMMTPVNDEENCEVCGAHLDHCDCAYNQDHCPECGALPGHCDCDQSEEINVDSIVDENADHDFGHVDHPDAGEPVDRESYIYQPPNGPQRITKGMMGDNSLIKENAERLRKKLRSDYFRYIAEADLEKSNASGAESPLTANNRDEFEKDPFVNEKPVTDGSRSPMSTIKRQKVLK